MAQANNTKALPLVQQVFKEDLTQEGLKEIIKRFPKDEVHDLSDDEKFRDARKARTEMNKLTKAINDRRIAFTGSVKDYADGLIKDVEQAYDPIVSAFLLEDGKRKKAKAEAEAKHEKMLSELREQIAGIRNFVNDAQGQDPEGIASIIESVDLIETDGFHKDVIHDAIEAKKETLEKLHEMYATKKKQVELDKEKAILEAQRLEQEKKTNIETKINNLRNKPMEYFGKPSREIKAYIDKLSAYTPTVEDFEDRTDEVAALKEQSIAQLTQMHSQALQIEQIQADKMEQSKPAEPEPEKQSPSIDNQEREALAEVNKPLLGDAIKSDVFEQKQEQVHVDENGVPEQLLNELAIFCDEAALSLMESEKLEAIVSKYF